MLIDGPLKVSVIDKEDSLDRELNLDFTEEFRALSVPAQHSALSDYVAKLRLDAAQLEKDNADRAGMLTLLQVAEQLLPHVAKGELALDETIVVEIKPELNFAMGIFSNRLN